MKSIAHNMNSGLTIICPIVSQKSDLGRQCRSRARQPSRSPYSSDSDRRRRGRRHRLAMFFSFIGRTVIFCWIVDCKYSFLHSYGTTALLILLRLQNAKNEITWISEYLVGTVKSQVECSLFLNQRKKWRDLISSLSKALQCLHCRVRNSNRHSCHVSLMKI